MAFTVAITVAITVARHGNIYIYKTSLWVKIKITGSILLWTDRQVRAR